MTTIICSILNFITNQIAAHFPDFSIGTETLGSISNAFTVILDFVSQVNFIVPLPTCMIILSLVYGIKIAKFSLFLINWVIRRLADFFP